MANPNSSAASAFKINIFSVYKTKIRYFLPHKTQKVILMVYHLGKGQRRVYTRKEQ